MLTSLVLGLAGLLASVAAKAIPVARAEETELYVYGTGIDGLSLQATSNGTILISENPSSSLYDVVLTADSLLSPWAATLSRNGSILTDFELYINPSADALDPIGLVLSDLASDLLDIVTTGFILYGTNLEYFDGTALLSSFWASPVVGSNGTYEILWNSAGVTDTDTDTTLVPVSIKTLAPTTIDV